MNTIGDGILFLPLDALSLTTSGTGYFKKFAPNQQISIKREYFTELIC